MHNTIKFKWNKSYLLSQRRTRIIRNLLLRKYRTYLWLCVCALLLLESGRYLFSKTVSFILSPSLGFLKLNGCFSINKWNIAQYRTDTKLEMRTTTSHRENVFWMKSFSAANRYNVSLDKSFVCIIYHFCVHNRARTHTHTHPANLLRKIYLAFQIKNVK